MDLGNKHVNEMDKQHRALILDILDNGILTEDRTGVGRIKIPGAMMRFDMDKGFPQLGLRHVPYKKGWGEMCAFLKGYTNAADFRSLGCDYWDANANQENPINPNTWLTNPFRKGEDDLGGVYGYSWRHWPATKIIPTNQTSAVNDKLIKSGYKNIGPTEDLSKTIYTKEIDQFVDCVETIIKNPGSSRILFHGWNPATLDEIALPACHLLYQFVPTGGYLNMCVYIRSQDTVLGQPTNVSQAAFLLHVVSRWTGLTAKFLTIHIGDAHIYANHEEGIKQFIDQEETDAPSLIIKHDACKNLSRSETLRSSIKEAIIRLHPDDFELVGYESRIKIPRDVFPMAV